MNKDTPFIITEWEWFKLKLELYALYRSAPLYSIRYAFNDEIGFVSCLIWSKTVNDLIKKGVTKEEHLSFYESWVHAEKFKINEILQNIPILKNEFNIDRDIKFEILQDYGGGSISICKFDETGVTWSKSIEEKKKR